MQKLPSIEIVGKFRPGLLEAKRAWPPNVARVVATVHETGLTCVYPARVGSSWTLFLDRTMMCGNPEYGAVMDIVVWLRSLGLGKYEAVFRENDIDGQSSRI